jgi:hypothetical protein
MAVAFENGKITSRITQEEIDWANDVMKRAETSWPDMADIDTARMILETGIQPKEQEKYYCKKCKSEYNFGENVNVIESCANCSHVDDESCEKPCVSLTCCACDTDLTKIPNYETPMQYEKRTRKSFPDNGLVWVKCTSLPFWACGTLGGVEEISNKFSPVQYIVIANPPVPPPDGWRPQ